MIKHFILAYLISFHFSIHNADNLFSICDKFSFLYPATQKVAGYYVIPSELFECLSVHLPVLHFRTLT